MKTRVEKTQELHSRGLYLIHIFPSGFYHWRIDRYWMKDLIHHQLAAKHNLWFSFWGVWYIIIRVIK